MRRQTEAGQKFLRFNCKMSFFEFDFLLLFLQRIIEKFSLFQISENDSQVYATEATQTNKINKRQSYHGPTKLKCIARARI